MSSGAPIEGYVDPSFPSPNGPDDAPIIIYGYTPTLALSVLALVLYALCLALHTVRLYLHRAWTFSILTIVGAVFEIVGYAFRLQSSAPPTGNPYKVINFIIQYFFIVVAPVFFSAAIYIILTSLIAASSSPSHPDHQSSSSVSTSPLGLPRKSILAIFITSDVVSTIVQVAGAALIGVAESNRKSPTTANNILLAGLAFQVFSFLVFLILLAVFLYGSNKASQKHGEAGLGVGGRPMRHHQQFNLALIAASLLIYLRTCFRLAETAQGVGGYLSSHEAYFGALEFAPVVLAVGILGWWHPGKWIPRTV